MPRRYPIKMKHVAKKLTIGLPTLYKILRENNHFEKDWQGNNVATLDAMQQGLYIPSRQEYTVSDILKVKDIYLVTPKGEEAIYLIISKIREAENASA